jgi:uncharacterized damage-inducible protein DinB
MSWLEQYRSLSGYNRWMNDKLYACAATLDDAERKLDRGAFFGSIHHTLEHILLADRFWLSWLTGDSERFVPRDAGGNMIAGAGPGQEVYADFDVLRSDRARVDADLIAWTESLDDAALHRTIEFTMRSMGAMRNPMWWAAGHMFNHQTHHRGQVTTLLVQAGINPGITDFFVYLLEHAARP